MSTYHRITPFLEKCGHKVGSAVCRIRIVGAGPAYSVEVLWRQLDTKLGAWHPATWTLRGDHLDGAKLSRVKRPAGR